MPPYHQNASMAQQRLLFAKAERGEVAKSDALGRARASKGKHLPERVSKRSSSTRSVMKGRR